MPTHEGHISHWIGPDGKIHPVKNLNWVLRHWKEVKRIYWHHNKDRVPCDGVVTFILTDGRKYITDWADFGVFKNWVDRPVFRGIPIIDEM